MDHLEPYHLGPLLQLVPENREYDLQLRADQTAIEQRKYKVVYDQHQLCKARRSANQKQWEAMRQTPQWMIGAKPVST